MSYSTYTTMLLKYPGLPQTTTASPQYTNTTNIITQHIADADAMIDGYLARRYSVPFTTVPPVIRTISAKITEYNSWLSLYSSDNQNESEHMKSLSDWNEWAIKYLTELKENKIDLLDTAGSLIAEKMNEDDKVYSDTMDYQPIFDMDDTLEWKTDQDRLDNIEDNR